MNNFTHLLKKEIKELLTKQTIIALLFIVLLYGIMGNFMGGAKESAEQSATKQLTNFAVLDLDKSEYSKNILNKLSTGKNIKLEITEKANINEAVDEIKEKGLETLLVIPQGFEKNVKAGEKTNIEVYSIIKGLSMGATMSDNVSSFLVNSLNEEISTTYLKEAFPNKNPENITNPLTLKEFIVVNDKIAPGNPLLVQALTMNYSIMIPIILMILIIYAGTMIMTSMGLEKENKTLETLLTLPIKRIWIVFAKMLGAAIVALIMALIVVGGFRYYMFSMTPSVDNNSTILETLGLTMSPFDYILLGISLFLAILIALSLCLILGMLSQDTKSAQSMNFPIILLVMIPYFLLMFQDIETLSLPIKILLYIIPFSHPLIASKALILNNYSIVIGGIIYMAVFAIAILYLAVHLFNTDKVLTAKLSFKGIRKK
ncbi:MAG: ABC transporter permease [Candidatus Pacebacteria bacterium]|nr:ABC transporter permease [Candidatus Paceibacterota bacterium]